LDAGGAAGASLNRQKFNTFPLTKLQTISDDDEELDPSDYERMDDRRHGDASLLATSPPVARNTGNIWQMLLFFIFFLVRHHACPAWSTSEQRDLRNY